MRIISERTLREFWEDEKSSQNPLEEWIDLTLKSDWHNLAEVRNGFNTADYHNSLVIFNIGGNKFRLITKIEYAKHLVFIKFIGTHKQYDRHQDWCDCGKKGKI